MPSVFLNTSALHTNFFWIFLGFYLLHELISLILESLNYQKAKKQKTVPAFYQDKISNAVFIKSRSYTLDKIKFGWAAHFLKLPFFWLLIFANGFNVIDGYAAHWTQSGSLHHSVLFCILIGAYFFVLSVPFNLYSTFVLEQKYGFNKTTGKTFVLDLIKGLGLSALLGIPLLYLIFWFMTVSGNLWWLYVWAVVMAFQFFIAAVYPTFLAPLFNKFEPLPEGTLKQRITELAQKIGFKMSGIFIIDGSKRSGHSNAYFAGMGKFRRIVLFDTLTKQLNEDELIAVLAHEMGHNVKKHIRNSMILSSLMSLVGFYILSLLIGWSEFYQAFNFSKPSVHAALVVFSLVSGTFTFLLTPLTNGLSRKNEYEADAFSVQTTQAKTAMKEALFKLSKDNLSNLSPHPAYSFYHYSHPTTLERARAIDNIKTNS